MNKIKALIVKICTSVTSWDEIILTVLGLRLMFGYIEGWMNEIKPYIVKHFKSVTSLDEKTLMFNRMKIWVTWLDEITPKVYTLVLNLSR